jgi:putative ABC transport system permease protein
MRAFDAVGLGLDNLRRTRLRTCLTTLGVVIGIGALVSMVSFGTGMQKNVSRVFYENDLFTSLIVTPRKIDPNAVMSGDLSALEQAVGPKEASLDDSALFKIRGMQGVMMAYPQIQFPVKIRILGHETETQLGALPARMGDFPPYNEMPYGGFFQSDGDSCLLIGQSVLKKMKWVLRGEDFKGISAEDSLRGMRSVPPDSLLGRDAEIITSVMDVSSILKNPWQYMASPGRMPTAERSIRFRISGILKKTDDFQGRPFSSELIIPMGMVRHIPRFGFNNVWDLLKNKTSNESYGSIYVRVHGFEDVAPVKQAVESMGFGVFAISDQLQEIRRGFLVLDTALGAVGAIALIVAALGIINTMIMSILERTREIGIMKSVGGSEGEIRLIFLTEAGVIGLLGGIFGILLGWIVTRIANAVANFYFAREGIDHVEMFYMPLWLIGGAIAFAIAVSVLAGLYPAARAAAVNPVEALRHE